MSDYLAAARRNAEAARLAQDEAAAARANSNMLSTGAVAIAVALQKARAEIIRLEEALAVKTADVEGTDAILEAYREQHPDSLLRADSGQRFKASGNVKSQIALIYEVAFDACLTRLGIADPASRRVH